MEIFYLTINQMLLMFSLILVGFILRKKSLIPEDSDKGMSRIEMLVFTPALNLYAQMTRCSIKSFKENWALMLYGLLLVAGAIALAYPISKLFIRRSKGSPEREYQRNIYKYALVFGNYGFMGNFIILGIWGEEMFYKYSLFCLFISILCNSWGLYELIPKEKGDGILVNLKKGFLAPPTVAMFLGIAIGLLDLTKYVPDFLVTALDNAGKCQGPVAMILAGFVIGGYGLKDMISQKKVYVASFLRLVAIPALMLGALKLVGASDEIMILTLVCFATPVGLNTIVFPAAYGGDTKTGAAMATVSSVLSVVTLPLMYFLFFVLL